MRKPPLSSPQNTYLFILFLLVTLTFGEFGSSASSLETDQEKIRIAAELAERSGIVQKQNAPEKWQQAIAKFEEALTLWRQLNDRQGELRMLTRLGNEYVNLAELQTALNYYREALQIAQAVGDGYQTANLLLGFGKIYHRQNEGQKALDAYSQARQAFASMSLPYEEAIALQSLGLIYQSLGDLQTSLEYLKRAAQTFSALKAAAPQCTALNGIGVAYGRMGQKQQALESFNQALALAREAKATDCEGRALRQLGFFYLNLRDKEKSLEYFNEGLKLCRAVGNRVCEATALRGLGSVSRLSGDNEKSLDFLQQALDKFRLSGERSREAITLNQMAQVNQALGNLDEARQQVERALDIMESVRADVFNQQLRESFFVSAQSRFDLYIELLMQLHQKYPTAGHDATALKANERARARGLLELLAEAKADIRQGVSPSLLDLERSIQRQINAKAAMRAKFLDDKANEAHASRIDKELTELTTRYREVEAQIRAASPRYAALTQPQPLSSAEIQKLLDEETVLLEFALGPKQSWLWAVTPTGLSTHQLPPRRKIETSARKVYELLIARQQKKGESEGPARIAEADAKFSQEAGILSQMLIGPIAAKLGQEWRGKRLLIVASGALEYLPFAALPLPCGEAGPQPLIAGHEIVNLPSASVLSVLRRETAERQPANKTIAILADPVFEADDPRVRHATNRRTDRTVPAARTRSESEIESMNSDSTRSQGTVNGNLNKANFSRLPFSQEEADAIAELVPSDSILKATDFQANRKKAMGGELSNYRIIHFATHGLLNSEHPELSGLVLSLIDENGKPQDGVLRMHEIYNLRLPADVVVLSACQTGLGKEIKGEGLIGLTRGFMYAGAQRVVASLWQVDDRGTAELMKHFYRGMLKEGKRPAAALRSAQIEMMKQKRWASPYFWAAFVMQGEWK